MPEFKNIIAGLALGTAIAGGALALSSTAASATIAPAWGGGCGGFGGFGGFGGLGGGFGNCNMGWMNNNLWNQNMMSDRFNDESMMTVSNGYATIAFQGSTNWDTNRWNNTWLNNNAMFGNSNFFNNGNIGGW